MFRRIRDFLYAVAHVHGRLFTLGVEFGPFSAELYVGREEPDAVRFALDVEILYGTFGVPILAAAVEVGVIKVELSLTRSRPE